jgi:hypothetical protein
MKVGIKDMNRFLLEVGCLLVMRKVRVASFERLVDFVVCVHVIGIGGV